LSKGHLAKVIAMALGLCLVLLTVVWIRAFYGSMHAYEEGEGYLRKQQFVKAITFFDRSIHWYTPFNPYVHKSAQRLWEICIWAEKKGDLQLALIAARTIRRGFLGVRSFYTPGRNWIDRSDTKIASLMSRASGPQQRNNAPVVSSPQQTGPEPDVFWTLTLEIGLVGWIGSVIGFLMCSLTGGQTPKLKSGPAVFWGILVLIFYTMWILGMMRS
jgi:hypothetical protein